jgi:predicted sulfurtransferase
LKQKLGFQDVRRLEKGIIGYEKWIEEHPEKASSSIWKGKNFLFDKRRFFEGEVLSCNDNDDNKT